MEEYVMKRIISILAVQLMMLLQLVACGTTNKPEDTAVKFCTAMQSFDPKAMQECFVNSEENTPDMQIFESDQPEVNAMMNKFKDWAAYMDFKVMNGTIDGDTATVPVEFTYVNVSPVAEEAIQEYLYEAMQSAMQGEDMSDEDMSNLMLEILDEKTNTVPEDRLTKTIELNLVKDGREWKLDYFEDGESDGLTDVLTCNMREVVEKYS